MRVAVVSVVLVAAMLSFGCGGSPRSCTTACGGAGGAGGAAGGGGTSAAAGAGGGGGQAASAGAGGTGGQRGSAGVGGAAGGGAGGAVGGSGGGAAGGSGAGGAGGSVVCGEPASCEGYDNRADANVTAVIACLSPSSASASNAFTLAVFGHHLATGPTDYAIVTVGGVPLNGVPASACHLAVAVPSGIAAAGPVQVVVSPGGRIQDSAPATLTLH